MYNTKPVLLVDEKYQLTSALMFVVSIATGVGFGDITAHNNEEMILVTLLASTEKLDIY